MDLAIEAAKFGPYAFFLMVILVTVFLVSRDFLKQAATANDAREDREAQRYKERQELTVRLLSVVASNTEAMTALRDVTQVLCGQQASVVQRVDGMSMTIERIDQTTMRIERIVTTGKS